MSNFKINRRNTSEIIINIAKQTLTLLSTYQGQSLQRIYSVSTAKNGIGSLEGTGCTPLGEHCIAEKIGEGMPINTVFVARKPTGEIYNQQLGLENPNRDWILTRILWLAGCEEGRNKGENVEGCCDTYQRYIYIHGTPDTEPMGLPLSHGCIRMRNEDLVYLFDKVEEGTPVHIIAD